jgi:hypothetical protein
MVFTNIGAAAHSAAGPSAQHAATIKDGMERAAPDHSTTA